MRFAFTEDQDLYRDAVRSYLTTECTPARVREAAGSGRAVEPTTWAGLADLGVLGTLVPEQHGGLGLDEIAAMILCEEAGRVALPGPLIPTVCVAPFLLDATPLAATWLPRIAGGDAQVAVSLPAEAHVAHADGADLLLRCEVAATYAALRPDVEVTPVASIDPARPLATVGWGDETLLHEHDAGQWPLHGAALRGAMGAAAMLVGLGAAVIEQAAEHARTREQFGRPIGSFQAVKHLLADALVGMEFARPAVERAAWSLATDAPDVHAHVAMGKALAGRAAEQAGRAALQVHGAIGYTWEADLHLWLKRTWGLAAGWGTTDQHRDVVADALGMFDRR